MNDHTAAATALLTRSPDVANAPSFEPSREAFHSSSDKAGEFAAAFGAKHGMTWLERVLRP
ncbi:hypothetical protein A9R05_24575 [Burkholderia sp. KK1]|nr:hypothetical protein A9R05_24575 [Burkholderia sp. KK1]